MTAHAGAALIVQGDALRLPLPDESVDLICTSPPFWALRAYGAGPGEIGSEPTPQAFLEALWAATAEMARVLKPSGSCFVDLGDSYSSGQRFDNEFTLEDGAWLGGVIDSDGSVSVHKQGTSYTAWVRVGQMRPEVVERIHAVTGIGSVMQDNRGCWNWQAAAQQAAWILARIWPWLHIKRRQALAAVELQERKAAVGGKGRWNALTHNELGHREQIRQAVLDWNAGRPNDHEPPLLALPDLPPRARWIPAKSLNLLPERYRIGCVDRLGLIARAVQIWDKPNGLPESVTDRVRRSHEDWVHLTKGPRYYSATDEIREPHNDKAGPPSRFGNITRSGEGRTDGIARPQTYMPPVREYNPLGKLPGSVWPIPSEPLRLPDHLGVQHYAAFPSEWPRRLILGFSPPGICLDCGQGRVPVVEREERTPDPAKAAKRLRAAGGVISGGTARSTLSDGDGARAATILGYACSCTPHTNHPGSGEPSGAQDEREDGRLVGLRAAGESRRPAMNSLQTYQRVGPWREYHLDRWQAPPTRPSVILDPFSGTGTVAMVARALDRIGVGVDLSHAYCRAARWRVRHDGAKAISRTNLERQGTLL